MLSNVGSTLKAGGTVHLVATGSGTKDANGLATDGDITARGTQISGQDRRAERRARYQSAERERHEPADGSNRSSGGSIGVGAALGGQQNGFTIELSANTAHGDLKGDSSTNRDTQINATDKVTITSGRDTNVRGAEVAGNTVEANVGRDLNIASQQDTNSYNSKQTSAGFQASICVPPICYGTTVQGSGSVSDQTIKDSFQSVNQQSGFFAGNGGYNINVGNHTQIDGGVIASTATADKNTLSTQTLGYTNLENHAEYSGSTLGFSASGSVGQSTPNGVNLNTPVKQAASGTAGPQNSQGFGPSGVGMAGTGDSASGTTYAAVSPGTITVRGDAGTGHDSTAGLSRDTANANGAVQNTFDAKKVGNDMAIQQATVQVGMQVVGDVAKALVDNAIDRANKAQTRLNDANKAGDTAGAQQAKADLDAATTQLSLWGNDGTARIGTHAVVAGVGAALGGGNVLGAMGGTVAGDMAGNTVSGLLPDTLGGNILSNVVAGAAGAAAGGALGGSSGAMSGANGALGADLYNRQLHPEERQWAMKHANDFAAYYESVTGKAISPAEAQDMLLANGYIRVDNAAASGPGYNGVAAQYLTTNAGNLFSATPAEMANPLLGRNSDGTPTPEVYALPGGTAVPGAGTAAAAGLGLTVFGGAAPVVATTWALGTLTDYTGDAIGHATGLSSDTPDFTKSFTVGGIGAATSPLLLPLETLGASRGAQIIVGTYNSILSGTTAFASTAITNPSSSPDLSGGLGTAGAGFGAIVQGFLPGPAGQFINQLIQSFTGPTQTAIEKNSNKGSK